MTDKKVAIIKRFEYWSLGSELKKQTYIIKKQYQGLYKVYEFDKENEAKQKLTSKKYKESDLVYNINLSFTNIIILMSLRFSKFREFLLKQNMINYWSLVKV